MIGQSYWYAVGVGVAVFDQVFRAAAKKIGAGIVQGDVWSGGKEGGEVGVHGRGARGKGSADGVSDCARMPRFLQLSR